MDAPVSFGKTDYVMMGLMLFVSMAIGVFFAVSGNRQRTQVDYLLGGRKMGPLPVCLSLFATFNSAISLLGLPAEVYSYGTMMFFVNMSLPLASLLAVFTVVPLIYPLGITSVNEYLERRYESKAVRLLGATMGMISNVSYMTIALLSPAIALQIAAGLPLWISLVLVGSVGTIYTTLGGMKGVVWTDAFQTIIIFGGILATLIKGNIDVGGLGEVWRRADQTGRLILDDFNPDPRVRHTFWGALFAVTSYWLGSNFSQSSVQRICSTKNIEDSRKVMLFSALLNVAYGTILILTGMTLVVYFDHVGCDPLAAGYITNPNQLMPYFVIHVLGVIPGISGLYISTIFSGALSTLSSGINSLAANTMEDFLHPVVKNLAESKKTVLSKVLVSIYGLGTIGLAYLAKEAKGTVTQLTYTALGASVGPVLGLFFLSGLFPQANKVGAIVGSLVSLAFSLWLNICSVLYGTRTPTLPPLNTDSCQSLNNTIGMDGNVSAILGVDYPINVYNHSLDNGHLLDTSTETVVKLPQDGNFNLFDISYTWLPLLGAIVNIFIGLITSLIFETISGSRRRPSSTYLFPFVRGFWRKIGQVMEKNEPTQEELECMTK